MIGRKMIGAVAMAAAVTGGAAVGALTGVPGVSGAQDAPTTTAPENPEAADAAGTGAPEEGHHRRAGMFGLKLEAAAEVLGISEEDLKTALKDGQTLADVAEANGVDRQAVVDALVAAGEAQLDELRETLPERMDEAMDRDLPSREGRPGHSLRERPGG